MKMAWLLTLGALSACGTQQQHAGVVEQPSGDASPRDAAERRPDARLNEEPKASEVAQSQHTPSGFAAPEQGLPAGGSTTAARPVSLFLGAWLVKHGAPAHSREVVDNQRTACERVLRVGSPPEEAIQCEVVIDSSGRLELDGHECETSECVHASMGRTRIFVWRESKLRTVLDVPSSVRLGFDGGTAEYIRALVTVAEDGLLAEVELDGTCSEAHDGLREDGKESSIRSTLLRFMTHAVDQVCAAQGHYTWGAGKFRR